MRRALPPNRQADADLLSAAAGLNLTLLMGALRRGANPNATHPADGRCALALLGQSYINFDENGGGTYAIWGHAPMLQEHRLNALNCFSALLQAAADPRALSPSGYGVLHNPAYYYLLPAEVPRLLRAGLSAGQATEDGLTPAHICAAFGQPHTAAKLQRAGADFGTTEGLRGDAPMHAAARSGNIEMLDWLLQQGHSMLQPNAHGLSPAQIILRRAHGCRINVMVDLALESGGSPAWADVRAMCRRVADASTYVEEDQLLALQRLFVRACACCDDGQAKREVALEVAQAIMRHTLHYRVDLAIQLLSEVLEAIAPLGAQPAIVLELERHLLPPLHIPLARQGGFSEDRLAFVRMLARCGLRPGPDDLARLQRHVESRLGQEQALALLAPLHAQNAAKDLEDLDALAESWADASDCCLNAAEK